MFREVGQLYPTLTRGKRCLHYLWTLDSSNRESGGVYLL